MSQTLTIDQAFQLAVEHHQAGRLQEAEDLYRRILAAQSGHGGAVHYLGVLALQTGHPDDAIALIRQAIALWPDYPEARSNLGKALHDMGRFEEAIAASREAVSLQPNFPEALINLGNALRYAGNSTEAIAAYRQAIALRPDDPEVYINLGNALQDTREFDEATAAYRRALALRPDYAEAHSNLGSALQHTGCLDEAIAAFRQALALRPNYPEVHSNLGNALQDQGSLDEAIAEHRRALALRPDFPEAHSNLVYSLEFHPGYDAPAIHAEARRWDEQHARPLKHLIQSHCNSRDPARKLRIGYVSPDFRQHATAVGGSISLLANHDHRMFAVYCYSGVVHPDSVTDRIRGHADVWRNTVGLSDQQLADLVREDQIDILVDLTMHMAGSRLPVFARKPAPIQVTWQAYPSTTGVSMIDYRLTDPFLDPPGQHDAFYTEESVRLPDSFWCYDPLVEVLPVNDLPAMKNGHLTLGCLNTFSKNSADVLALWARVMQAVPGSRLLLLAPFGHARERVANKLREHGIAGERIEFTGRLPRMDYLNLLNSIDLGLNPFPYNGHVTSLDAFWMGVPTVTLVGERAAGRAGWSQLCNLGLEELAARTPEQYVEIVAGLAGDLDRLAELRRTLRERMQASPLMDAPRFARNVEAAYRAMWRRWCDSKNEG